MAALRVKRRRNRFTVAILQGVGIYFVGYIPAWRWGNPMIPMGMTSLMMILVAVRLKSVRQGFIRGLILGTLAGMAIWGGMDQFHKNYIAVREWQTEPHPIEPAKTNGAEEPAGDGTGAGDSEPPVASAAEPPEMTEVVPYAQDERDKDKAHRDRLPYLTIPPPMAICPVIGMVFADLAGKRRAKVRSMWD